jgi:anti-sigma regulatory factor (Ser/Thr protein kinase)
VTVKDPKSATFRDAATFPPDPTSVAQARHFVVLRLTLEECPERTVRDAELLVSELATNAVQHARAPFSVALIHDDRTVTIEVADTGEGEPTLRDGGVGGGHGLRVLRAIADDWGVRRVLEGKAVFFQLPC